ncbi:hypothetical protein BBO99_00001692 [Phytophthora kernoviae]|uniref:Uncharacterized protein n=1 Tax=Phytophthora kernoviae TaxID=325452 RepID=A0A421F9I3_9STRA|nr:hypothetical protein BBI17_000458 [Phytophthora kernoviae]RLN83950.1 hypothetical protein BBO99_00001692 [Phytophthora kernoviae]
MEGTSKPVKPAVRLYLNITNNKIQTIKCEQCKTNAMNSTDDSQNIPIQGNTNQGEDQHEQLRLVQFALLY